MYLVRVVYESQDSRPLSEPLSQKGHLLITCHTIEYQVTRQWLALHDIDDVISTLVVHTPWYLVKGGERGGGGGGG